MMPHSTDQFIACCVWVAQNSVDQLGPLNDRAENWIVQQTMNDCIILAVILLHFKNDG